jgi:hypothetical protein
MNAASAAICSGSMTRLTPKSSFTFRRLCALPKQFEIPADYELKVQKHWTEQRVNKVTSGRKYKLTPDRDSTILYMMGLLNKDGSMSANKLRKYKQVNHLC